MPRIKKIDLVFEEVSKTTANVHKNSPSHKFKVGQKVKLVNNPVLQEDVEVEVGTLIGFRTYSDDTIQGILYYYESNFMGISRVKGVVIIELEDVVVV